VPPPASVLVVVTRRLGDVLLATPLFRSIKAAWPQAAVDALLFAGTREVVGSHPDVRRVLTVAELPGWIEHAAFIFRLIHRYDLALSCVAGDRPTLYAGLAGRHSVGLVRPGNRVRWQQWLLSQAVEFDDLRTHTVAMNLALADALGIAPHPEIRIRWTTEDAGVARCLPADERPVRYAALHVHPKFNYKMWHVEGWVGLAQWLHERGIASVLTGEANRAKSSRDGRRAQCPRERSISRGG
jgi:heptosyltransferase-3